MNKVILMGRLTRDPEVRYSGQDGQMAVARFTLAVDRRFKRDGEPTADFLRCVAFRQRAEFAEKYLHQGSKILVEGSIQTGSYTNKDGATVYTTDIMVENMEFAESKNAAASGEANFNASQNAGPVPSQMNHSSPDGFMNVPEGVEDDGLPFN